MIGYLDTAAFIPLLVVEPGSAACRRFWDLADDVVSCQLLYVESAAALAQAHRMGRLDTAELRAAMRLRDDFWQQINVTEVDEKLIRAAAGFAEEYALRGYDAVHCAAAAQLDDPDLVAASGDQKLLAAWKALGIATFDTNAPDE
ncbi:type II toxin-antitoxin system VapC family toxin [Nocardia rhizosphaerihabitans]|uniref:type II toxin-antitoxin system VapC family toxin n=1 Tax=Nocardia rhizosphaerihabitans TaxID=1691570 RepID=UPI00366D707B